MQNQQTYKKYNALKKYSFNNDILKNKYVKITIGAVGIIATLAALGSVFQIVNYTVTNYKILKETLYR